MKKVIRLCAMGLMVCILLTVVALPVPVNAASTGTHDHGQVEVNFLNPALPIWLVCPFCGYPPTEIQDVFIDYFDAKVYYVCYCEPCDRIFTIDGDINVMSIPEVDALS